MNQHHKRKRPAPGAYANGRIYISNGKTARHAAAYVSIPNPHLGMTADELREAAHMLNQVAEYLEQQRPNDTADAMAYMFAGFDEPKRFECSKWPDCGCPDGTIRADCPGKTVEQPKRFTCGQVCNLVQPYIFGEFAEQKISNPYVKYGCKYPNCHCDGICNAKERTEDTLKRARGQIIDNYRVTVHTNDGPQLYRDFRRKSDAEDYARSIDHSSIPAWAEMELLP